jgi:hypothetical protein
LQPPIDGRKHKEEETMFKKTSSGLYIALWFLLIGGLGLAVAPAAHAVQASGSISLIPDNYNALQVVDGPTPGADVFVKVLINNTSSDTPAFTGPPPPPPVQIEDTDPLGGGTPPPHGDAKLTKNIIVTLACDDNECTMPHPGVLQFLGCDMAVAGVTCTPLGTNQVQINVPAGGIDLPAGTKPVNNGVLDLVRLHLKVLVTKQQIDLGTVKSPTYMHAMTDGLGIMATSSVLGTPISCMLDGCTLLTYAGAETPMVCQKRLHQPAAQILLGSNPQIIQMALGFVSPQFPVANGDQVTVELIKVAGNVSLFKAMTTKPQGLQLSGGSFVYDNPGAAPPAITHVDIDPGLVFNTQIMNLRAVGDLTALLPTQSTPIPVIFRVTIGTTTIDVAGDLTQNPAQPATTLDFKLAVCPRHMQL